MARTLKDLALELAAKSTANRILRHLQQKAHTMQFLTGYKTFIIAGLMLALAALQALGIEIPGYSMGPTEAISVALGLIFSRLGAKTEAAKRELR